MCSRRLHAVFEEQSSTGRYAGFRQSIQRQTDREIIERRAAELDR